ncbi:MAG: tetratricopeptide repeat protein [Bacteroidia bacterium]|nr:tetratricopeptide repeat protein [Bacteroidia bacterium]MDW8159795.1 tetratricopeptide repeat protein [Bacteroidia bacterium]
MQRTNVGAKVHNSPTAQVNSKQDSRISNVWFFHGAKLRFLVLMIIGLIFYANTITNEFALDDINVIQLNYHTKQGFAGIPALLTKHSFHGKLGDTNKFQSKYYRPLSIVTFAIEYELWKENPHLSHAINLFIYLVIIALLYYTLAYQFLRSDPDLAFFATLIFAIHPIHTEVVANIKSRDELMGLAFGLSALALALRYQQKEYKQPLLLVIALFSLFLGLLSKENAINYIAILPLSLFFFTGLGKKEILQLVIPFILTAGLFLGVRLMVIGTGLPEPEDNILNNRYVNSTLEQKYATITYILGKYFCLLVFPYPLSSDYSYHHFPDFTFADFRVWLALIANLGMLAYGIWGIRYRCPIAYGILWYLGTLFLVSNLVLDIGGFVGERFLFLPSVGYSIALAAAIFKFVYSIDLPIIKKPTLILRFAAIAMLILFAPLTWSRNKEWHNNQSLFFADIHKCPNSALMNHAMGSTYMNLSEKAETKEQKKVYMDSAIKYLKRAIAIYPRHAVAYYDLGRASHHAGYSEPAIEAFHKSLAIDGKNHLAWYNLGIHYASINRFDEAIDAFKNAIRLSPKATNYHYNLSATYFLAKRYFEAKAAFENLLAIDPQHQDGKNGYSLTLAAIGESLALERKYKEAVSYLEHATKANPMLPDLWFKLGVCYYYDKNYPAAKNAFTEVLKRKPGHAEALNALRAIEQSGG